MFSNDVLRQAMRKYGVILASTVYVGGYDSPDEATTQKKPSPIVQLTAEKWVVVDVDNDQGLGEFLRRLAAGTMAGLEAYVLTDKGALLVYRKDQAHLCSIPADVRYERISAERGHYDMRCLSKIDGKPRVMVAGLGKPVAIVTFGPHKDGSGAVVSNGCKVRQADECQDEVRVPTLPELWTELARQAAGLGVWVDALKPSERVV